MDADINELVRQLEASEGAQIGVKIRRLQISYSIFRGNYTELKNALDNFRQPAVGFVLFLPDNRDELDAYQHNVIRLLHNFLASAKTLVGHMRIIVREVFRDNQVFLAEYQSRIDQEFTTNLLVQVVHKLRNYILHKGIQAFCTAQFKFNPPDFLFLMNIAEIINWSKWTQSEREYLKAFGTEIRIDNIVIPYAETVTRFHQWFDARETELNQAAYAHTAEIRRQLDEALGPAAPLFMKSVITVVTS
jgi:hypothetical protein